MKVLFVLLVSTYACTSFAIERCNYPTEFERSHHYDGALWADGSWVMTKENVIGPCADYGRVYSELQCYNLAKKYGFEKYQVTTGNHLLDYNGSLWNTTSYYFKRCFACH